MPIGINIRGGSHVISSISLEPAKDFGLAKGKDETAVIAESTAL